MITGTVNAYRELIVGVTIPGTAEQEIKVEAVIDTGFDGSLSLPPALIALLGLP